jgi:serine/threonine protein kinase
MPRLRKFGNVMKVLAPVLTSAAFASVFLALPGVTTVTGLVMSLLAGAVPSSLASWGLSESFKNANLVRKNVRLRGGNGDSDRIARRRADFLGVRIELINEYVSALEFLHDHARGTETGQKIEARIKQLSERSVNLTETVEHIVSDLEAKGLSSMPPRTSEDIDASQIIELLDQNVPNLEAEIRLLKEYADDLSNWAPSGFRATVNERVEFLKLRRMARESELDDIKIVVAGITDNGLHPSGYEFVRVLGVGGMGAALLCFYPKQDRFVAVKVQLGQANSEVLGRFHTEAKIAMELNHENIARGYDFGEDKGEFIRPIIQKIFEDLQQNKIQLDTQGYQAIEMALNQHVFPYYTSELIRGYSLEDHVRKYQAMGKKLEFKDALDICLQILNAIEYYANQGLVHRDLKPDNVMLRIDLPPSRPGYLKLIDFGIAKSLTDNMGLTMTGIMMGTPYYASPEQLGGKSKEVDIRTDLYALGCILYEVIAGEQLFLEEGLGEIIAAKRMVMPEEKEAFAEKIMRTIPDIDLANLAGRMLSVDPALRPNIEEIKAVFRAARDRVGG